MTIKGYISLLEDKGNKNYEIARILGISSGMVSSYKTQGYNPSLKVAKGVFKMCGIVLFPFSKEGVSDE